MKDIKVVFKKFGDKKSIASVLSLTIGLIISLLIFMTLSNRTYLPGLSANNGTGSGTSTSKAGTTDSSNYSYDVLRLFGNVENESSEDEIEKHLIARVIMIRIQPFLILTIT